MNLKRKRIELKIKKGTTCYICGKKIPQKEKVCYNCKIFLDSLNDGLIVSEGELTDVELDDLLKELLETNPGVNAAAIASTKGLAITSMLPQTINEAKIAVLSPMLCSLSKQMIDGMGIGNLDQLHIHSSDGNLIIRNSEPNAVLTISTRKDAKLGSVFIDLTRLSKTIPYLRKDFKFKKRFNDLKSDFGDIYKPIESKIKEIEAVLKSGIKMKPVDEKFDYIIKKLLAIPEVIGAALTDLEGLPIVSVLHQQSNGIDVAVLSAEIFSLAKKLLIEMEKGEFYRLDVKGKGGYLLIFQASPNAILTIFISGMRLGLISLDIYRLIRNGFDDDREGYFPYPYIFKPPYPPEDIYPVGQPQAKRPTDEEEPEYKPYCKHCGAELPKGQTICHVCGKKVI